MPDERGNNTGGFRGDAEVAEGMVARHDQTREYVASGHNILPYPESSPLLSSHIITHSPSVSFQDIAPPYEGSWSPMRDDKRASLGLDNDRDADSDPDAYQFFIDTPSRRVLAIPGGVIHSPFDDDSVLDDGSIRGMSLVSGTVVLSAYLFFAFNSALSRAFETQASYAASKFSCIRICSSGKSIYTRLVWKHRILLTPNTNDSNCAR